MNDKLAYEKNKRRIFMSKYEQAIKLLEMLSSDEFQQFTSSEFDDAIYTAIEALEKQLPKMPIKSDREIRYCDLWKCPSCGFEWSARVIDFCYKCGQRLDWEGIE